MRRMGKQSIEIIPEMTQIEYVDKDIKITIVYILHLPKTTEKGMSMIKKPKKISKRPTLNFQR